MVKCNAILGAVALRYTEKFESSRLESIVKLKWNWMGCLDSRKPWREQCILFYWRSKNILQRGIVESLQCLRNLTQHLSKVSHIRKLCICSIKKKLMRCLNAILLLTYNFLVDCKKITFYFLTKLFFTSDGSIKMRSDTVIIHMLLTIVIPQRRLNISKDLA